MKEWIHVISNQSIDGLVLVGCSQTDPEIIAQKLAAATKLPTPYVVEYEALNLVEPRAGSRIAETLSSTSTGNGWFRCSALCAVIGIRRAFKSRFAYELASTADIWMELCYGDTPVGPDRRREILTRGDCPADIIKFALAHETKEYVLEGFLNNPKVTQFSDELFERWKVSRYPFSDQLANALLNVPDLEESQLESVANNCDIEDAEDRALLIQALRHPNASSRFLAFSSWIYSDREIHEITASHTNWSDKEFLDLMRENAKDDPLSVLSHPNCPEAIVLELTEHFDISVRIEAVSHVNCPTERLIEISFSDEEDDEVCEAAFKNSKHPIFKVKNPDISSDLLRDYAGSQYPIIRAEVAQNPSCASEILDILCKDEDDNVRKAVACASNLSPYAQKKLSADRDPFVRRSIATRPDCSTELLNTLLNDEDEYVIDGALENPKRPKGAIIDLAMSESADKRLFAVRHKLCPLTILQHLLNDPDEDVQHAAYRRLNPDDQSFMGHERESIDVIRERFQSYVRRVLGALIDESELLRLANLHPSKKAEFIIRFPTQAKQLELFERYIMPRLCEK